LPKKEVPQPVVSFAPVVDLQIDVVKGRWDSILDNVKKKSIFGYVSLHEGEPLEINDTGKLIIAFRRGYVFHKERLEEMKNKLIVEDSVEKVLGRKLPIECIISDERKEVGLSAKTVAEFFEGKVVS